MRWGEFYWLFSVTATLFKYIQAIVTKMGEDVFAMFVHIFEQAILMDNWLGKEKLKMPTNTFHTTVTHCWKEEGKRFQTGKESSVRSFCWLFH